VHFILAWKTGGPKVIKKTAIGGAGWRNRTPVCSLEAAALPLSYARLNRRWQASADLRLDDPSARAGILRLCWSVALPIPSRFRSDKRTRI
jgi:hypothetical protein